MADNQDIRRRAAQEPTKRGAANMQGVMKNQVLLVPHSEEWEWEFETVRGELLAMTDGKALDIQHVGSTAIRGIMAKPILDVAVRVRSFEDIDDAAMTSSGYENCGYENASQTRLLYVLRSSEMRSLRHIHFFLEGEEEFEIQVRFRDYMNAHPKDAKRYEALKKDLAEKYAGDRKAYTKAKDAFLQTYDKVAE